MKKILITLIVPFLLLACSSADSNNLAQQVCDCYKKANAMDPSDPKRTDAQNDCVKQQGEVWNKVKDNQKKADAFNKYIQDCTKEMIKQSLK